MDDEGSQEMTIDAFDHTMLQCFRDCPRKFKNRHVLNLVSREKEREFIPAFGGALHKALEYWYNSKGDLQTMLKAFNKEWEPYEGTDPKCVRTQAKGIEICIDYVKRFPHKDEPFIVLKSELGFAVDMGFFIYYGRTDGLLEFIVPGMEGLYIREDKTSSMKGSIILTPHHQMDGYIYSIQQLMGEEIKGGLFNRIYFYKVNESDFCRDVVERSERQMHEWEESLRYWVMKAQECEKNQIWPMNTGGCSDWGGCHYLPLCANKLPEYDKDLKTALYRESKWHPFDELEEKK